MYLEHFHLQASPFDLAPNPHFFCELKGHQEALHILQLAIQHGDKLIKIIGDLGTGKTLLCKKLLEHLNSEYRTIYLPHPDLNPIELCQAIAREIGLDLKHSQHQDELLTTISQHFIQLQAEGIKVVCLIDEAHTLSDACLETIRLLTETNAKHLKCLQVVLFAEAELDEKLNHAHLQALQQSISFSYALPLLNRDELEMYLCHRLAVAGYTRGNLFTHQAKNKLFKASQGLPRIINILAHQSLVFAYRSGEYQIDHRIMSRAIRETESAVKAKFASWMTFVFGLFSSLTVLATLVFLTGTYQ